MKFFVFATILWSCNAPTPTPTETSIFVKSELVKYYETTTDGKNYSLVGDTTLQKNTKPLHPLPSQIPNLSNLQGTSSTFRYVAIGASLTAGVRDGGWFNDGIATSYPNLIARQMGISDYKQPYFKENEFNGYGVKLPVKNTETPIPRYKAVSNNLAFKPSGVEMILTPYDGKELDNFAVPNLLYGGHGDLLKNNTFDNKYYKIYLKRIIDNEKTIRQKIDDKNANFFSLEFFTQDLINYAVTSGQQNSTINILPPNFDPVFGVGGIEGMIKNFTKSNLKNGFILDIPNILTLPYFKKAIKFSQIKAIFDKFGYKNKDYGYDGTDEDFIYPTPELDSLFQYQNNKNKFLEYYLKKVKLTGLLKTQQESIKEKLKLYRENITYVSQKYSIPIVDINKLYEQIGNGTYISEGGRRVSDKEFFSTDGIYPSAYGQAIIANECIKTINSFYKTSIPLIKTDYYLNR